MREKPREWKTRGVAVIAFCLRAPFKVARPTVEQAKLQDGEAIGQVEINLIERRGQRFAKLVHFFFAEARLPTLLDLGEKWTPNFLGLLALVGGANEPGRARRLCARDRRIRGRSDVSPASHGAEICFRAGEPDQADGADSLLRNKLHAVCIHRERNQPKIFPRGARRRAVIGSPMWHLMLKLVVELNCEGDQRVRQQRWQW